MQELVRRLAEAHAAVAEAHLILSTIREAFPSYCDGALAEAVRDQVNAISARAEMILNDCKELRDSALTAKASPTPGKSRHYSKQTNGSLQTETAILRDTTESQAAPESLNHRATSAPPAVFAAHRNGATHRYGRTPPPFQPSRTTHCKRESEEPDDVKRTPAKKRHKHNDGTSSSNWHRVPHYSLEEEIKTLMEAEKKQAQSEGAEQQALLRSKRRSSPQREAVLVDGVSAIVLEPEVAIKKARLDEISVSPRPVRRSVETLENQEAKASRQNRFTDIGKMKRILEEEPEQISFENRKRIRG